VLHASIKWKTEVLQVNGISVHVEDHGSGKPVLLLHGWPDSAYLWRNQIPFLAKTASTQSRRTCVASDAPIAPKEWARIPCRTRLAMWSASLTRTVMSPFG
jgi:pimeloyl-ACP methyl ester carboxylesterase